MPIYQSAGGETIIHFNKDVRHVGSVETWGLQIIFEGGVVTATGGAGLDIVAPSRAVRMILSSSAAEDLANLLGILAVAGRQAEGGSGG